MDLRQLPELCVWIPNAPKPRPETVRLQNVTELRLAANSAPHETVRQCFAPSEWPKIGEGDETELRSNMVFSMHPHAISDDGQACLYMQDTWLVTADGGVPLADLPMKIFDGTESRS